MSLLLVQADARHLPFADGSVQTCVTSPPYWGLRDYGIGGQLGLEPTPDAYVQNLVAVFREVWRVLKADGTCWLNLGDSYTSAGGGGEARMVELHGERDTDFRRGVITEGRSGKRHYSTIGLKPKDLVGIPWLVAFALRADGWYLRSDIIWSKPNPMPESVLDRPTKAHEYVFLLSKSQSYYFDADAVREPHARLWDASNGGSWSYGVGDAQRVAERGAAGTHSGAYPLPNPLGRNIRSVWSIATQAYGGAHFATFPEKLVERCVLAGSKSGDLVLDPFMGSGTVARVALRLGRKAIGCDLNPAYLKLADDRTRVTYGLPLDVA